MRKITVYSTIGKGAKFIETDAVTWANLKTLLQQEKVDLNNMKAVIGENKLTLESDQAQLPDGEFTLFLMPVKTKSGGLSRSELFTAIKEFVKANPEKKGLFVIDGKNMTQLSTPVLQELYDDFIAKSASSKKPVAEAVAEVVETVAVSKSGLSLKQQILAKADELQKLAEKSKDQETIELVSDFVETIRATFAEAEVDPEAEAKKKLEERLAKEAADLARQFSDVRK